MTQHPPVGHNLFNRCCHFAYGDAAMWLKCVRHPQNAIFTQNFAMSATPGICFLSIRKLVHYRCPCYHLGFFVIQETGSLFVVLVFFSCFFLFSFLSMSKLVHYHYPCFNFFFFLNQSGNWFIIIVLVFACFFFQSGNWFIVVLVFICVFYQRRLLDDHCP